MTKSITIDTCEIVYEDSGKGGVIVFLHGFCEDRSMWKIEAINVLRSTNRLILIDLPGFGESKTYKEATIEWYASVVKCILDANGIQGCSIVGHSMGGYIGIALAELFPQYLKSLILLNSHVFSDSDEKKLSRKKVAEFVRKHGSSLFVKDLIPGLFWEENVNVFNDQIIKLIERAEKYDAEGIASASLAMGIRHDREQILHNLKIPVLGIFGKHDTVVPVNTAVAMMAPIQTAVCVVQEKAGHMSWMEDSNTAQIIQDFVQSYHL